MREGHVDSAVERVCSRPYRLLAFDWDGTAVADRKQPADAVVPRVEALGDLGVMCAVVTGTNIANLEDTFFRRVDPAHRQPLLACMNRGSEVFGFDAVGRRYWRYRRRATPEEDRAMDQIAIAVCRELRRDHGLTTQVIFDRVNRRKIDLIPLDQWADPPKERIGELLAAVNQRLQQAGVEGGIRRIMDRVQELARQRGVRVRLTTDVKHVELGLTDKSDAVSYLLRAVARPRDMACRELAFLGDEFGPIDGFAGSDARMLGVDGAVYLSVGPEPNGVPDGVVHLGGGVQGFLRFLDRQIDIHRGREGHA